MALNRERILQTSLEILTAYGLGDLSMRRVAAELGVAPGALYYHVRSKQELLGLLAARMLAQAVPSEAHASARRSGKGAGGGGAAEERFLAVCHRVREALVGIPDAADVVGMGLAMDPAALAPVPALHRALVAAGASPAAAERTAWAAMHLVLAQVAEEQTLTHRDVGRASAAHGAKDRKERQDLVQRGLERLDWVLRHLLHGGLGPETLPYNEVARQG